MASAADDEHADMPRNSIRVRFDLRAPPLDLPAFIEFKGGEEVMLAAIDPGSGYQRSVSEMMPPLVARQQRKLVNDRVDNVLGDVHRVRVQIVGLLMSDKGYAETIPHVHTTTGSRASSSRIPSLDLTLFCATTTQYSVTQLRAHSSSVRSGSRQRWLGPVLRKKVVGPPP